MTRPATVEAQSPRRLPSFFIEALEDIECLRDGPTLRRIVRELGGPELTALELPRRELLVRLLEGLAVERGGMAFFLQELVLREGSTAALRNLRTFYAVWEVELVAPAAWEDLFEVLDRLHVADLHRRYNAFLSATRRRPPRIECAEPWVAFLHSATLNARPGESLPCFQVLAHLLAIEATAEDQARILAWVRTYDRYAGALEVPPAAVAAVAFDRPVWTPENYLIIRLRELAQPDRHGNDLLLSHWIRVHPHPQCHGDDRRISTRQAEREVRKLVRQVEEEWADALLSDLAIEFVLPSSLLGLPVERWLKTPFGRATARLGEEHEVIVRSLERCVGRETHGRWRQRWSAFVQSGTVEPHLFGDHGRALLLADRARSIAILSRPPGIADGVEPDGAQELDEALRAGVPIVLWDRRGADDPGFRAAVVDLLTQEDPRGLPEVVRRLRITAKDPVGDHLALLWDDPERLPGERGPAQPGVERSG